MRSAIFRAASKAALRPDEERKLTMKVCSAMLAISTLVNQTLKHKPTLFIWNEMQITLGHIDVTVTACCKNLLE